MCSASVSPGTSVVDSPKVPQLYPGDQWRCWLPRSPCLQGRVLPEEDVPKATLANLESFWTLVLCAMPACTGLFPQPTGEARILVVEGPEIFICSCPLVIHRRHL